jgi:hypothetical protein
MSGVSATGARGAAVGVFLGVRTPSFLSFSLSVQYFDLPYFLDFSQHKKNLSKPHLRLQVISTHIQKRKTLLCSKFQADTMNNCHEHHMMPGLYDDEFFDFKAASAPDPSNNHLFTGATDALDSQVFASSRLGNQPVDVNNDTGIARTATGRTGDELCVLPLTESEIESILAVRAANGRKRTLEPVLDRERKPDNISQEQARIEGFLYLDNDPSGHLQADHYDVEYFEANLTSGIGAFEQTRSQDPAEFGPSEPQDTG